MTASASAPKREARQWEWEFPKTREAVSARTAAPDAPGFHVPVNLSTATQKRGIMAAIFEAPAEHEAAQEWEWEHPETHAAQEWEWEHPETHETQEWEWEHPETHAAQEREWEHPETHAAQEWEWEHPETHAAQEREWEHPETHAAQEWEWEHPETHETHEWEWEQPETHETHEWELEADPFFGGGAWRRLARGTARIARRVAPSAIGALGSMIPGVGAVTGPLLGQLAQGTLNEGEAMAAEAETESFGGRHSESEVGHSEIAHEAALSELLAAEAAMASSEAEAASAISAALPLTITSMRAGRAVRPVMPVLTQANARLARATLRTGGPRARQLLRAFPSIQRLAVGCILSAARAGQPVTASLAVGCLAAAAHRVLTNPRRVEAVIQRNLALRQRTAPPHPRRALVYRPQRAVPYHPRRVAAARARPF